MDSIFLKWAASVFSDVVYTSYAIVIDNYVYASVWSWLLVFMELCVVQKAWQTRSQKKQRRRAPTLTAGGLQPTVHMQSEANGSDELGLWCRCMHDERLLLVCCSYMPCIKIARWLIRHEASFATICKQWVAAHGRLSKRRKWSSKKYDKLIHRMAVQV